MRQLMQLFVLGGGDERRQERKVEIGRLHQVMQDGIKVVMSGARITKIMNAGTRSDVRWIGYLKRTRSRLCARLGMSRCSVFVGLMALGIKANGESSFFNIFN